MKNINANTRISELLKGHPAALDTIIGISPRFARLRNPFQRKLMAARTSIATASRMAGCTVNDFFIPLERLGFIIEKSASQDKPLKEKDIPASLHHPPSHQVIELDVRPIIESGEDPLSIILAKVKALPAGKVLKIVNTFEPVPLIVLLGNKGFQSWSKKVDNNLVYTYFLPPDSPPSELAGSATSPADDWEELLESFSGKLTTIDVRHLEMPMPMLTIVGALDNISTGEALFVNHRRIPVFLLPELAERGFGYRIREFGDEDVKLLIFKDDPNWRTKDT